MAVDVLPKDAHNALLVANVHPPDWRQPNPAPRYNLRSSSAAAPPGW